MVPSARDCISHTPSRAVHLSASSSHFSLSSYDCLSVSSGTASTLTMEHYACMLFWWLYGLPLPMSRTISHKAPISRHRCSQVRADSCTSAYRSLTKLSIRHLLPDSVAIPLDTSATPELVLQCQSSVVCACCHWHAHMGLQGDRWWYEHRTNQEGQHDLRLRLQLGIPEWHERKSRS